MPHHGHRGEGFHGKTEITLHPCHSQVQTLEPDCSSLHSAWKPWFNYLLSNGLCAVQTPDACHADNRVDLCFLSHRSYRPYFLLDASPFSPCERSKVGMSPCTCASRRHPATLPDTVQT